ncbi:glucose-1-phosphate thymidylyltransferase [Patulibacter sp. NPDC049589]|uniref:glucose-1-phosphate thymidylyltransferase n=1 Tax=Patulibacter sp. NPDC049589 TaxID=3154731 RepID=UPI0034173501
MAHLKGLILSGGRGTRLRPITHTSAKQLVPVANQPVLFYGIRSMVQAGITEIGIILNPETGGEIREVAGDGSQFGAQITYIDQTSPDGLAHAVLTAEPFLGESSFVMYLGDNLLQGGISELVQQFEQHAPDAMILLQPVEDPTAYGVAELQDGRVTRLVEKPQEPKSDLALVGVYLFTKRILQAAKAIDPSPRGELEITDAIQWQVDQGDRVEPHVVHGWWKDTGKLADMLEANRLILETIERRVDGQVDEASNVEGRVIIEAGAQIVRSVVRGPVVIGHDAVITDSYVGPYSAIARDAVVERSEVEHSILLERAKLIGLEGRIESSLLGRDVIVRRGERTPRAYRFMVGDNSEIEIL